MCRPAGIHELVVTAGKRQHGAYALGHEHLHEKVVVLVPPFDLDPTAARLEGGSRPRQPTTRTRRDSNCRVARFEWRDASDRSVDPVGDRAECIVVEARHLPRVDRAVGSIESQRSQTVVAPIVTG